MASNDNNSNKEEVEGRVVHTYLDHSNEIDTGFQDTSSGGKATNAADRNFPVKLHYMLSELEADNQNHIVSWAPHGRCFVVHDQEEFVRSILPMWFRQTKFASFQRQLNLYGFKRITTGRDKKGYYHELFLRSRRFLSHRIPRIKLKGTGSRKPTSPETEPNFYLLPYLPPETRENKSGDPNAIAANALLGPMAGLTGVGGGGGLSSLERLAQASALPNATASLQMQQPNGFGPLGQLSALAAFSVENPVLAAQARAYALALQMPGLGFGGGLNPSALFNTGLLPSLPPPQQQQQQQLNHPLLASRDMAMRIALLRSGQQGGMVASADAANTVGAAAAAPTVGEFAANTLSKNNSNDNDNDDDNAENPPTPPAAAEV